MLKNIYAPLSGGIGQERLLEILSNNVANASTVGFKEDEISFEAQGSNPWDSYATALPPAPFKANMQEVYPLRGNEMNYTTIANVKTSFQQGAMQRTGNNLDFGIQGNGFFVVMTPFGERFTRDGGFTLTPEGMLTTKNGFVVQGENGALVGLRQDQLKVMSNGEVYMGDRFVDKLKVAAFEDTSTLQRLGSNLWVHDGAPENIKPLEGEVSQGYLESSNVNPMKNMTSMIIAHRTYEALQKAIKAHDDSMQTSNNKVGSSS